MSYLKLALDLLIYLFLGTTCDFSGILVFGLNYIFSINALRRNGELVAGRTRIEDASLRMRLAFAAGFPHTRIRVAPWSWCRNCWMSSIIATTCDWKLW